METSQKRDVPSSELRVSTQSHLGAVGASEPGLLARSGMAVGRRLRAAGLPLACGLFVAVSALALLVPPDGAIVSSGVTIDAQNRVIAVDTRSDAWAIGIRPGWQLIAKFPGETSFGLNNDIRMVADNQTAAEGPPILGLIPALIALLMAVLLAVARQRRTGKTVAVAGAVLSAPIWAVRFGVVGAGVAILPVGLAAMMAWQTATSLGIRPRPAQPRSNATLGLVGLGLASAVALAVATVTLTLAAGVAVAAAIYLVLAWVAVVRWRAGVAAAGPDARSRLPIARAVALDMLPFSGWMRRRAAQSERDRLASDLHAEVLPAIASTAAALEKSGATDEADRLRDLAASVRDMVSERRLPILDDDGLVAAAEWLAERLQERAPLTVEIDLAGDTGKRQPRAVERASYRILQLALDNVIRHAGAANAFVAIAGSSRSLDLVVADDGKGIGQAAAARARQSGHLGLADMRAEAESIGATLDVAPRSPIGTTVKFRWRG